MYRQKAALIAFVIIASMVMSQPDGGRLNTAVTTRTVPGFRLPAPLRDLSVIDGQLHFVAGNMLVTSQATGPLLSSPAVDTFIVAIDPELTYAVRDPLSNNIYYTKNDSKGKSQLYVCYEKKPGKFATRRVKLPGLTSSVSHPVFTLDGRAMIFVSDSPLGFGGSDLWFSVRNGEEWLSPQNMGHHVNSGGDEVMPSIYGDFLVFSSNGRSDSYGGFDLYAARIVALTQGDTVMMYPIGRSPAFSLQAPFCTADDDLGLVATSDKEEGWWLRRAADSSEAMHHFTGHLDCVEMRGVITSTLYDKIEKAYAVASYIPRPGAPYSNDTVWAQSDGSYTLYLQSGMNYRLTFHAANHYVSRQDVVPERICEERLYAEVVNDIKLRTIAFDSAVTYPDLFSSSVSSELSPAGRAHIDSLVRFIAENPGIHINVFSTYNLSVDVPFCSLLNGSRLRSLSEYLVAKGVAQELIHTYTTMPSTIKRADTAEGKRDFSSEAAEGRRNLSPVAQSSLTVAFSFLNF